MKAIEQLRSGLLVGHAQTGDARYPAGDGEAGGARWDTVALDPLGGLSVRFLGVDAPEVSFTLPGGAPDRFLPITEEAWVEVLDDPLSASLPPFDPPLTSGLRAHLTDQAGPGTAANHAQLAREATLAMRGEVTRDMTELGQEANHFQFFLAFAGEVMDRYGRLLCYLNRDEPEPGPGGRPDSYNERLLAAAGSPRTSSGPTSTHSGGATSTVTAVPRRGTANVLAERESSLQRPRLGSSRPCRRSRLVPAGKTLRLFPFELPCHG